MSSGQLKCQECDQEFTLYTNLIRHVNTLHGNESRKDNEARKDRLLKCTDIRTFEETGIDVIPRWRSSHQRCMLQSKNVY